MMTSRRFFRFSFTAVFCFSLFFFAGGQDASGFDWLKKGKDLLNSMSGNGTDSTQSLTESDIVAGLKEALRVGSETVVGNLGKLDGFNADPAIHIPLPEKLQTVKSALSKIGMSSLMENLELRLNRAAEQATPKAKALFVNAISEMTLEDAMAIYKGSETAATDYFREKMSAPLATEFKPIVETTLSQAGAVQIYEKAMGEYRNIPFVPDLRADLTEYVTGEGIDGIFHYLAKEEAEIRKNPLKRTTDLLKKVFGN